VTHGDRAQRYGPSISRGIRERFSHFVDRTGSVTDGVVAVVLAALWTWLLWIVGHRGEVGEPAAILAWGCGNVYNGDSGALGVVLIVWWMLALIACVALVTLAAVNLRRGRTPPGGLFGLAALILVLGLVWARGVFEVPSIGGRYCGA
jgi:hypothetical protein